MIAEEAMVVGTTGHPPRAFPWRGPQKLRGAVRVRGDRGVSVHVVVVVVLRHVLDLITGEVVLVAVFAMVEHDLAHPGVGGPVDPSGAYETEWYRVS